MSDTTEMKTRHAAGQTAVQLQRADQLPLWLALWAPLAAALGLMLIWHLAPGFYLDTIAYEDGLLEFSHFVIPLVSVAWCLRILALPEARRDRLVFLWIVLGLLGSVYMAGEEISWGQQYFHWLTPADWQAVNDQGETNLHNTSAWFDQKPRTILEIGVVIGGIVIPLLALWRPALRAGRLALLLPPLACLPVAALCEVAKMTGRLQSLGLWRGTVFENASEAQELYIYLFILFYLVVFRNRVLALRAAGLPLRPAAGGQG